MGVDDPPPPSAPTTIQNGNWSWQYGSVTNNPISFLREIKIKGQSLEVVENFKYLGSIISNEGSKPETLPGIVQTTAALSRLRIIWRDKNISLSWCWRSSYLHSFIPVRAGPWQQNSKEGSKPLWWDAIWGFWTFPSKTMWRMWNEEVRSRIEDAIGVHDDLQ